MSEPSLSSYDQSTSPAHEVDALIVDARKTQTLDPTLETIYAKHKDLFLEVFQRQVNLLKTRSQILADAHITVYDKVLLALTDHGDSLDNPAAITWYCSEYFGFNPDVAWDHNVRAIEQSLAFPVALTQSAEIMQESPSFQNVSSANKLATPVPTSPVPDTSAVWSAKDDANWQRFCNLYDNALEDFNSVADQKSHKTQEAARWLRDTAENGIHFLQQFSGIDDHRIRNLNETCTMAQRVVEELTGGRKRKFDGYADVKVERQMRVKTEEGHKRRRHEENEEKWRRERRTRVRSGQSPRREDSERRARISRDQSPRRREDSEQHRHRDYHRSSARERSSVDRSRRSPATRRRRHSSGHGSGRGHSDVPYGYAEYRRVDSYVPTRDDPDRKRHSRRC